MQFPEQIEDLAGEYLAGIHFVQDYVEFYFDGPIVRSLAGPIVRHVGNGEFRFPMAGSRDALCVLIGQRVASIDVREEEAIYFRFDSGAELLIPTGLRGGADPSLPETAHFVPGPNQPIAVW